MRLSEIAAPRSIRIPREDVGELAVQAAHDLLEPSQRDALLALLKPVQGRNRQTQFPGKLGKSLFTAPFAKERTELFFERFWHRAKVRGNSFHLRNI